MAKYIDYKTFNPIYAPGLSTYAVRGEKGEIGKSGTGVYYNKNSIKRNQSEIDSINGKILRNELLSSYTNDAENKVLYKKYDIVIDSDGDVYYIVMNNNGELVLDPNVVGNISASMKKNYATEIRDNGFTITSLIDGDRYLYNVVYLKNGEEKVKYTCSSGEDILITDGIDGIKEVEVVDKITGKTAIFVEN